MLDKIDTPQFHEWMAYYRIEPWGEAMHWSRHGHLSALVASMATGKSHKPTDFIPDR